MIPQRGVGTCPELMAEERVNFKPCNEFSCGEILQNKTTLTCVSKVDLIVLMDGSGSLRDYGWKQTVNISRTLVENLEGGMHAVRVAVQLFSGPKTWGDYAYCTGEKPLPAGQTLDLARQCGISWVSHFTDDLEALDENLKNLKWPASSTLTSVALGEAKNELMNGRKDANTVVVVITDGKPMSRLNTVQAVGKLSEIAKVVWVPVGLDAPIQMIEEMAAKPTLDHIVRVDSFDNLAAPETVNAIMTDVCPIVE
jgi:hypothetical protein